MATPQRDRRSFRAILPRRRREGILLLIVRARLHHGGVIFPDLDLLPVDPGAEGEVAGDEEEDACDDAGDDGGDVGARGPVGVGAAVGAVVGDGPGLRLAGCEGPGGGGLHGGGEGRAARGCAADGFLDRGGHGVAVAALEA